MDKLLNYLNDNERGDYGRLARVVLAEIPRIDCRGVG